MDTESALDLVSIPGYYYHDPAVLQRELAILWHGFWQLVGRVEDLAAPGDYLACQVGEQRVLLVRDEAGQLRGFHNVCAHRGMALAEGRGQVRRFQCPYHGWTYGLDGGLRAVPHRKQIPCLDMGAVHLTGVQVDTWGGFVFVKLTDDGESLADFLGSMKARWETYHDDWWALREVRRLAFHEPFNWKLFMENSVDYYHIPFIHPETLELPPVVRNQPTGWHFGLTSVSPEEDYERFFDLLFPNAYFHVGPSKVQWFRVTPVSPGACHIEIRLYQTPAQARAYPINDDNKHRDIARILEEDFRICRVLQGQTLSPSFRIRYSARDLEEGVAHFGRTLMGVIPEGAW